MINLIVRLNDLEILSGSARLLDASRNLIRQMQKIKFFLILILIFKFFHE